MNKTVTNNKPQFKKHYKITKTTTNTAPYIMDKKKGHEIESGKSNKKQRSFAASARAYRNFHAKLPPELTDSLLGAGRTSLQLGSILSAGRPSASMANDSRRDPSHSHSWEAHTLEFSIVMVRFPQGRVR